MRICLVALLCAAARGQPAGDVPSSADQKRLNIESFEFIWSTIRDQYWDPTFGGINWAAVHDELRPQIERATTKPQARAIMRQMISRLGKSHFAIIPDDVCSDIESGGETAAAGTAGLDARVIDGMAVVVSVDEGSPAAAVGVHPGWEILSIGGAEITKSVRKVEGQYKDSTARDMYLARSVLAKLGGEEGSTVRVEFREGAGGRLTRQIQRIRPAGTLSRFGYLPPAYVWIKSRKLAGNIGYIAFNLFLDPEHLMPEFGKAVRTCGGCAGVIIDLRGNPGGLGVMAMGMAGYFIDAPDQRLGTMHMRQTSLKFTVNPRPPTYHGPLAILVDGGSASTSEIFASGLKDLGRARIFGTRTAGAALPSAIDKLPNGDAFQHALADYISEGGRRLEGVGVLPDVEVRLTREALLQDQDPVLDAAIEWINARK